MADVTTNEPLTWIRLGADGGDQDRGVSDLTNGGAIGESRHVAAFERERLTADDEIRFTGRDTDVLSPRIRGWR